MTPKCAVTVLKCITQTGNASASMCTAHMRKTAFLRFINLQLKFCFWGTLLPDPHHQNPAVNPHATYNLDPQPQKCSYDPGDKNGIISNSNYCEQCLRLLDQCHLENQVPACLLNEQTIHTGWCNSRSFRGGYRVGAGWGSRPSDVSHSLKFSALKATHKR